MDNVSIRGFEPEKLVELATKQTKIYNEENSKLPEYIPAKIEDTIMRFRRKEFDQTRMFYAYDGNKIVGYSGLTGRDMKKNLRGVGYPWLTKKTDPNVRNLLYQAIEKKCRDEGTKTLQVFGSPRYPIQLNFFKSKGFGVKIEFLTHQKHLTKNVYSIPAGYRLRDLKREDLKSIEDVSSKDPKMKSPFIASDFEKFQMDSRHYQPGSFVVAEKDGSLVGFYGIFLPPDRKNKKAYFNGVAVLGGHEQIEPIMLMELENRALTARKEVMETSFFPDSPRMPLAQKQGYKITERSYQLEKAL